MTANPNKALWEKGDFTRIASAMRASGEALVASIGVTKGQKVLDLGCGDGTTAIPAAQRGADVLGVDIAQQPRRRGEPARAGARPRRTCASRKATRATCGRSKTARSTSSSASSARCSRPSPFDVAKEMVRVTRPGGRIVMGNWIPNDPTLVAQILKISSAYTPPPPEGFVSPMTWGVESHVLERFAGAGVAERRVSFAKDTFTFDFDGAPAEFVDEFRRYYGPTMNAFDAAEKNGRTDALRSELEALFASQNRSGRADRTTVPATFLRVTVSV